MFDILNNLPEGVSYRQPQDFGGMPIQNYNGWNLNPAYMTPASMAHFRPAYNGAGDPRNPYARNDSIAQSAWLWGPGNLPSASDPLQEFSAHQYNMSMGVGDGVASGIQKIGIPLASFLAMNHMLGKSGIGAAMGRKMGTGAVAATGGILRRSPLGRLARGHALDARMAAGLMSGATAGAGAIGGFVGGFAIPMLAAEAMAGVADNVIDPYVSTRRGMDAMMANHANTAVLGTAGNKTGGFGMSATRAFEISQALTEAGQEDFMLRGTNYNEIADQMTRAGMFQEIGDMDADRIVDGVKSATSVLKLMSRITGDPDILNGISTLAKLKAGGLDDIKSMETVMHSIKRSATTAGMSVNQFMDTIGDQGMVMAQQYGIKGVTGILAAGDAMQGFSAARRAGLLSGAQMNSLGGLEGMTQHTMQGMMTAFSHPYARMIMQGGGSMGGSAISNILKWGGSTSGNPIAMQGDWFANKANYMDKAFTENGPDSVLKMFQGIARMSHLDSKNGLNIAAIAEQFGLGSEQFRSIVEYNKAMRATESRMAIGQSHQINNRSDHASQLQQENLGFMYFPLFGVGQEALTKTSSKVRGFGANTMEWLSGGLAAMTDAWDESLLTARGQTKFRNMDYFIGDKKYSLGGSKAFMPGNKNLEYIKDDNRDFREQIMATLHNAALSPVAKKQLEGVLTSLEQGDTEGAMEAYRQADITLEGYLTGAKSDMERTARMYTIEEKFIDNLNVKVKDTGIGDATSLTNSEALINNALRKGSRQERRESLKALIENKSVSAEDIKAFMMRSIGEDNYKAEPAGRLSSRSYKGVTNRDANTEIILNTAAKYGEDATIARSVSDTEKTITAATSRGTPAEIESRLYQMIEDGDISVEDLAFYSLNTTGDFIDADGKRFEKGSQGYINKAVSASARRQNLDPVNLKLKGVLQEEVSKAGMTMSQLHSHMASSGLNPGDYNKLFDPMTDNIFGDDMNINMENLGKALKGVKDKTMATEQKFMDDAANIDWSGIKTLEEGVRDLGMVSAVQVKAIQDNTIAQDRNTAAIRGVDYIPQTNAQFRLNPNTMSAPGSSFTPGQHNVIRPGG